MQGDKSWMVARTEIVAFEAYSNKYLYYMFCVILFVFTDFDDFRIGLGDKISTGTQISHKPER